MVFWLLGGIALLAWLGPLLEAKLSRWRPVSLDDVPPHGPESLPRLSVVLAARDEEATIGQAMRTLLAMDDPGLEIVAVDDRSADRTGAILDALAAEDPRLRVVHVRALPPGWLGKNHALHVGSREASGDFLLFTDADVHFAPTTLRRAVRHAEARRLDHLTLFPEIILKGFWETVAVWFFGMVFSIYTRPWKVPDPRSKAFTGVGAFNMARADTYRRAGGHAALPMDVADDMKLGKRIKECGGRSEIVMGGGLVRVRWVEGLRGIVVGLTKNMYAGFGFRPLPALVAAAGVLVMATWPAVGLFAGPWGARGLCAVTLGLMVYAAALARPRRAITPLYGLAFPLAGPIVAYIILRSMLVTHRQGGIVWRGTLYPLHELRKGLT